MAIQMQAVNTSELDNLAQTMWNGVKPQLNPIVWKWYDAHKDQKVTTILKVYTVTIGSFGIAEAIITHLFGPRPS